LSFLQMKQKQRRRARHTEFPQTKRLNSNVETNDKIHQRDRNTDTVQPNSHDFINYMYNVEIKLKLRKPRRADPSQAIHFDGFRNVNFVGGNGNSADNKEGLSEQGKHTQNVKERKPASQMDVADGNQDTKSVTVVKCVHKGVGLTAGTPNGVSRENPSDNHVPTSAPCVIEEDDETRQKKTAGFVMMYCMIVLLVAFVHFQLCAELRLSWRATGLPGNNTDTRRPSFIFRLGSVVRIMISNNAGASDLIRSANSVSRFNADQLNQSALREGNSPGQRTNAEDHYVENSMTSSEDERPSEATASNSDDRLSEPARFCACGSEMSSVNDRSDHENDNTEALRGSSKSRKSPSSLATQLPVPENPYKSSCSLGTDTHSPVYPISSLDTDLLTVDASFSAHATDLQTHGQCRQERAQSETETLSTNSAKHVAVSVSSGSSREVYTVCANVEVTKQDNFSVQIHSAVIVDAPEFNKFRNNDAGDHTESV
jgi:hypothetical protein